MSRYRSCTALALALSWLVVCSADARERTDRYGDPLPPGAVARMGSELFFHGRAPQLLAFSPDGKYLAVPGDHFAGPRDLSGFIRLFDPATGRQLQLLQVPFHVMELHFSPDSKRLIAEEFLGVVQVWDASTGKELHRLKSDGQSYDGKVLIEIRSGKDTTIIRFSEIGTRKENRRITIPRGEIRNVVFAPDKRTFAGSSEQAVFIWEAASGKELHQMPKSDKPLSWLAYSPNGKTLAAAFADRTIRLWDAAGSKELHRWKGSLGRKRSVPAFSPDGKMLAVPWKDKGLRLVDTESGKEREPFNVGDFDYLHVAFSPDGKTLAYGGDVTEENRVHIWDLAAGKERRPPGALPERIEVIAFSTDGKSLLTAGGKDEPIRFWEAATGEEVRQIKGPKRFSQAAVSPNGRMLAAENEHLQLWDLATGKEINLHGRLPEEIKEMAISPDGRLLAVSGDREIRLWDATTAKELRSWGKFRFDPIHTTFSANGKILVACIADKDGSSFTLWDTTTGKPIRRLRQLDLLRTMAAPVAVSPDSRLMAVVERKYEETGAFLLDARIVLWDTAADKAIRELRAEKSEGMRLAFSPDGRSLAVAYQQEDIIRLWETATGQPRRKYEGHRQNIHCLIFSGDGSLLATGGDDRTALVWDLTGRLDYGAPGSCDLSAQQQQALWDDLAAKDAANAYRAMCRLIAGKQTPALLGTHFRPIAPLDDRQRQRLRQWIADLDSPQFETREKATKELTQMGDLAEPALRAVLAGKPSLEVRRRLEPMLILLDPARSPKRLRMVRAVEVLEHLNSPPSRELLQVLAGGAAEARLTREAKASLDRLSRRHCVAIKVNAH